MIELIVKIEGYLRLSFSYGSSSSSRTVSSQCWTGAYTTAPSGEGLSFITEGAPWKSHCDSHHQMYPSVEIKAVSSITVQVPQGRV